jgi:hypothetical protein
MTPRQVQRNKVVLMAENLVNELITWKEKVDEEKAMEQEAP